MSMAGYFTGCATTIELGQHVFATPAAARRNLRRETHCSPAPLLDSGGGVLEIEKAGCGG
jgi:hypothetical protein